MKIYFPSLRVEEAEDVFLGRSHSYKYIFLHNEMCIKYVCIYVQLLIQQIFGQTYHAWGNVCVCVCVMHVCTGHLCDSFFTTSF